MENLEGLNNLSSSTIRLSIVYNDKLLNLQGLDKLTSVLSLSIQSNDALKNLHGLENLELIDFIDGYWLNEGVLLIINNN